MMSWTEAILKTLAGFAMAIIVLAFGVVMIDAIGSSSIDSYVFVTVSKRGWKQYFSDIPLPNRAELLISGFETGQIDTGNSEELDYGYYWVIKSDLTSEELTKYYLPYVEESNQKFGGYETIIDICQFDKQSFGYIFQQLDSVWDQIKEKEEEINHIWVIVAFKPGRGWFKN